MSVLVVAAHDGKTVRANVANAVAAATQLDSDVHVLVAGQNAGEAAKSAAALQGVTKVLQAEDAAYANWLAEDVALAGAHVGIAIGSVGVQLLRVHHRDSVKDAFLLWKPPKCPSGSSVTLPGSHQRSYLCFFTF